MQTTSTFFAFGEFPYDWSGIHALPFVVVRNCCLDCLLGQDRAMNFDGRQAVQGFHHSLVCKFERIIDGFTFDEFCRHRTSSNCGATSERFKCHICDDIVFYFNIHTHNVATTGISHLSDATRFFYFSHIAGICKMIHDFFTVCHKEQPPSFYHSYDV